MKRRWFGRLAILVLLISMVALPALAQRGRRFGFFMPASAAPVKYDGRFTIVRLWYQAYPGWSFDYPDMEQNLSAIMKEITSLQPQPRPPARHHLHQRQPTRWLGSLSRQPAIKSSRRSLPSPTWPRSAR